MAKCRCSWLFVFDNVEDATVIDAYLPRGRGLGHAGHVATPSSPSSGHSFFSQYAPIQSNVVADRPTTLLEHESAAVAELVGAGHVLVTSRVTHERWVNRGSIVSIDCFVSSIST